MFWTKLCKSTWNCVHGTFISPIVWNMCENLPYESVYFKELHNEQECYWPTKYRAGAAVVSTITSVIWSDCEIVIRNFPSRWASEIWDNFEISRVVFMPNVTYKSCYYLFILVLKRLRHVAIALKNSVLNKLAFQSRWRRYLSHRCFLSSQTKRNR